MCERGRRGRPVSPAAAPEPAAGAASGAASRAHRCWRPGAGGSPAAGDGFGASGTGLSVNSRARRRRRVGGCRRGGRLHSLTKPDAVAGAEPEQQADEKRERQRHPRCAAARSCLIVGSGSVGRTTHRRRDRQSPVRPAGSRLIVADVVEIAARRRRTLPCCSGWLTLLASAAARSTAPSRRRDSDRSRRWRRFPDRQVGLGLPIEQRQLRLDHRPPVPSTFGCRLVRRRRGARPAAAASPLVRRRRRACGKIRRRIGIGVVVRPAR